MLNCVGVWFQVEFWKVFNICTAEINWQDLPPPAYFNPIYEAGLFLYSPGDMGRAQWYEIDWSEERLIWVLDLQYKSL